MMDPVAPSDTVRALATKREWEPRNALLGLYALTPRPVKPDGGSKEGRKEHLYEQVAIGFEKVQKDADNNVLPELLTRQLALLWTFEPALRHEPVHLELVSDFTCGLSLPTLLHNGLMLLRPYGIPVIPASAVKGVVASWLAEMLEGKLNVNEQDRIAALRKAGLLEWFGSGVPGKGSPGSLVFFDALPENPHLRVDVTTVHHQAWYGQEDPPHGCDNPIPVHFLTVGRGTAFRFCCAMRKPLSLPVLLEEQRKTLTRFGITATANPREFLRQLFESTGRFKGFGSQTSVGYGRMQPRSARPAP